MNIMCCLISLYNAFALVGRGYTIVTISPGCCPGLTSSYPFRDDHQFLRIYFRIIFKQKTKTNNPISSKKTLTKSPFA